MRSLPRILDMVDSAENGALPWSGGILKNVSHKSSSCRCSKTISSHFPRIPGRSSTSSLHTVGTNQMNGSNSSQQRKKVSINEHPVTFSSSNRSPRELSAKLAASTNNLTNASVPANSLGNSNHRTSLLHISGKCES